MNSHITSSNRIDKLYYLCNTALSIFWMIESSLILFVKIKTKKYNKLPCLIKITLYYEVPQNALCSLCLHCLNTGSKTQEVVILHQRSKPPEIRCVRFRYTAVKMSQSKGFCNKWSFRLSSFFNLEIQKKKRGQASTRFLILLYLNSS